MIASRLAELDKDIETATQSREACLKDAHGYTETLAALRRERERVAGFPNVGKPRQTGQAATPGEGEA